MTGGGFNLDAVFYFYYETYDNETGIADGSTDLKVHIFPNPAFDRLNINSSSREALQFVRVRILDLSGKVLYSFSPKQPATSISIPTVHLANGLYYVQWQTHFRHGSQSFVVQH